MQILERKKQCGRRPIGVTDKEWLMARVRKTRGCWFWEGYSSNGRYGHCLGKPAHVLSYEVYVGPVPKGVKVLHKCDNGFCVRPSHLFLGSQSDNAVDMLRKGRGGQQKITMAIARRIRAMDRNKAAERYDLHPNHVDAIKRGRYWSENKHGLR